MPRNLRFSPAAQRVLEYLVAAPSRWHHGYALMAALELRSGTLYPVLMRLAEAGWLETRWESHAPNGRPPRHLYRIAGNAEAAAHALLAEWARRTSIPGAWRSVT